MKHLIAGLTMLLWVGCGMAADETKLQSSETREQKAIATDLVPEFRHPAAKSRFRLGENVRTESTQDGIDRIIGLDGTLATFANGATVGIASAYLPGEVPAMNDASKQGELVLQYFKDAGLPPDQVGKVLLTTQMLDTAGPDGTTTSEFMGYNSIIDRQVEGIRIAGSHAWARMNQNGESISESIYWPAFPRTVVTEAHGLQTGLAGDSEKVFRSKLPTDLAGAEIEIVIVHSPYYSKSFGAVAAIQVKPRTGPVRNFRLDGSEAIVPVDQMTKPASPRK